EWDGEPAQITERSIEALRTILDSGLDDFCVKEIGVHHTRLDNLWKAGLVKKYASISPTTRPKARWGPDYEGIRRHLSTDPEIYRFLQEAARRKLTIVQTDRFRSGTVLGDCRVPYRGIKKFGPY
ncbi:MAG: hypothetical protein KAJ19_24965, partial [Gammaproteobacteria bacterium]|nr:hypothetical protein [Gammaproteobacteria bacterium]